MLQIIVQMIIYVYANKIRILIFEHSISVCFKHNKLEICLNNQLQTTKMINLGNWFLCYLLTNVGYIFATISLKSQIQVNLQILKRFIHLLMNQNYTILFLYQLFVLEFNSQVKDMMYKFQHLNCTLLFVIYSQINKYNQH